LADRWRHIKTDWRRCVADILRAELDAQKPKLSDPETRKLWNDHAPDWPFPQSVKLAAVNLEPTQLTKFWAVTALDIDRPDGELEGRTQANRLQKVTQVEVTPAMAAVAQLFIGTLLQDEFLKTRLRCVLFTI
jgi:hypothetical protein